MNKQEKSRKTDNRGFTLVEMIVVLVIMAVLASAIVPSLTGYINRANEEKVVSETRSLVMAAQTVVAEAYADGSLDQALGGDTETETTLLQDICELGGLQADDATKHIAVTVTSEGELTGLEYAYTSEKSCVYNAADGSYDVQDAQGLVLDGNVIQQQSEP